MPYKSAMKARDYQRKAVLKARTPLPEGRGVFAWLMAMRTGKTKVSQDDFGERELAGDILDQLVIAPGGAIKTWPEALDEHWSEDLKERSLTHLWRSGMGSGARRELEKFLATQDKRRPRTLMMNIEALSRPGDGRDFALEFLSQRKGKRLINIDEVATIKNKSKRTDFILRKLGPLSDLRRIMSGLATPRSPLDLFYEFSFLDEDILGFDNWYSFRAHVAHLKTQWLGGRSVIVIDQDKGDRGFKPEVIEELHDLIEPYSYRVEFRPKIPSTYTMMSVELTKEQERAYREIRDDATTKIGNGKHVTATVVIAQIMRLHQVLCGFVGDEEGDLHEIPENRTSDIIEFLEDYAGKAVIWCSYDYNVRKMSLALERAFGDPHAVDFKRDGVVGRFWGGNNKTRDEEIRRFMREPKCRFCVATPDAGRYGNTWDMADLAIYFSSKDNLDHREQSEQRTMGVEKIRGVDNVDFIASDTVEIKILQALRSKINMATVINGDNYREWLF